MGVEGVWGVEGLSFERNEWQEITIIDVTLLSEF